MTSKEAADRKKSELLISGLTQKEWYATVYMQSLHWRELKAKAYEQYGRKCNRCASTRNLQVHHKKYRSIYDVEVSDLEILCKNCHQKEHDKDPIPRPKKVKERKVKRKRGKKKKSQCRKFQRMQAMARRDWDAIVLYYQEEGLSRPEAIRHLLVHHGQRIDKPTRQRLKRERKLLEAIEGLPREKWGIDFSLNPQNTPF